MEDIITKERNRRKKLYIQYLRQQKRMLESSPAYQMQKMLQRQRDRVLKDFMRRTLDSIFKHRKRSNGLYR